MDGKMIIFSKGINGCATYSIYTKEERKPIFTNKTLEEISKNIIRAYPDISQRIFEFHRRDFSGDFPEEIDLSRIDPGHRAQLIELIASQVNRVYLLDKNKV